MADHHHITSRHGDRHTQHRVDIDGLRALAVVAVVLFHADLLPGGFAGVDIFFVISGYLMTSIIMQDLTQSRLSVLAFYARRARRIIPALMALIVVIAILASLFMLPHDTKDTGRSIIAASTFTSNNWFRDIAADYFESENVLYQPLLHSWSLSVEAQFYLIFPVIMIGLWRWMRRHMMGMLVVLALMSLSYSAYTVQTDPQASFYLLFSRMWELLAGAVIYFLPPIKRGRVLLIAAGVLYLLLTMALYNPHMGFPGTAALLPVIGACLILYARPGMAAQDHMAQRILSFKPVTFFANISYSLYLWHWPLFVFARYNLGPNLPLSLDCLLIMTSIFLAFLSWNFVEQPMLRKKNHTPLKNLAEMLSLIAVVVVLGIIVKNVVPKYAQVLLPSNVVALANAENDYIKGDCVPGEIEPQAPCRFGDTTTSPDIFLWGNSFARMWTPALDAMARDNRRAGLAAIRSACRPDGKGEDKEDCVTFNDDVLRYVLAHDELQTVILSANWALDEAFTQNLARIVAPLSQAGRRVFIVLNPPEPGYAVPRVLALAVLRDGAQPEPIDRKQQTVQRDEFKAALAPLIEQFEVRLIDPVTAMCTDDICPVQSDTGDVLYYDRAHVTKTGALIYQDIFSEVFGR